MYGSPNLEAAMSGFSAAWDSRAFAVMSWLLDPELEGEVVTNYEQ